MALMAPNPGSHKRRLPSASDQSCPAANSHRSSSGTRTFRIPHCLAWALHNTSLEQSVRAVRVATMTPLCTGEEMECGAGRAPGALSYVGFQQSPCFGVVVVVVVVIVVASAIGGGGGVVGGGGVSVGVGVGVVVAVAVVVVLVGGERVGVVGGVVVCTP